MCLPALRCGITYGRGHCCLFLLQGLSGTSELRIGTNNDSTLFFVYVLVPYGVCGTETRFYYENKIFYGTANGSMHNWIPIM